MARVLESFYDTTTLTQYHEGDEYPVQQVSDDKTQMLVEKGMISEQMTNEPQGETFDAEPEGYEGYNYEGNYRDAQQLAEELGVDVALNSGHEVLIEAIESEIG